MEMRRRQSSYGRLSPSFSHHHRFPCQTQTTKTDTDNLKVRAGLETRTQRELSPIRFFFFFFLDQGMKYKLVLRNLVGLNSFLDTLLLNLFLLLSFFHSLCFLDPNATFSIAPPLRQPSTPSQSLIVGILFNLINLFLFLFWV